MSLYVPPRPAVTKAATGTGVGYYLSGEPTLFGNDPQSRMRRAWQIGTSVPWIRAAERVITGLGSTVPWHLEDADDTEVDDKYQNPTAQEARLLIEKPQAALPVGQKLSRRELWALTLRHIGLCGNAFWLLDQLDPRGIPAAVIYIRPDRMTPVADTNLRAWVIDADARGNGIPVSLDQVIQFVLEPPDEGYFGIGLVESAMLKAELSTALDRHLATILGSGGRMTGILAPKTGIIDPEVYNQLTNDWRVASEAQDAARRLQVVRAPVDFLQTTMSPEDLSIRELMTGARDDLLSLWGMPASSLGLHDRGKGLGATAATSEDGEALWQNAVIPRLTAFREPLQFELLDRFANIGLPLELELDTPEFDDDTPQFDKLQKAVSAPLTNNQRLEIIGLEPLPDYGPDGEPLGLAIYLPLNMVVAGQGPEPDGGFSKAPKPEPKPTPPALPPGSPPPNPTMTVGPVPQLPPGKADPVRSVARLRAQVERHSTPVLRGALATFLTEQRRDIAARLRAHAAHITEQPSDTDAWFAGSKWDRRLRETLAPHLTRMAEAVSGHIAETLPAKAGSVGAVERALDRGAARVTNINETTRRKLADAIARALEAGDSPLDLADAIEGIGAADLIERIGLDPTTLFSELRAETIARTELMDAYNGAAIGAYGDAGVRYVQAIDGDGDPECRDRDGQTYSITDAGSIEDHPNGTLDWVPLLAEEAA